MDKKREVLAEQMIAAIREGGDNYSQFGDWIPCQKEELQEAKDALLEQMIAAIRELAKKDSFWIVKSIEPGSDVPDEYKGKDLTVGWKIHFPQMQRMYENQKRLRYTIIHERADEGEDKDMTARD